MLCIGLTGGIGCGKSTAAQMFADLGAGVVDADRIAHRLTAAGQPALAAIRREFGPDCFLPDGSFDRATLRRLVFSDQGAKAKLEGILHPLIRQEVMAEIAASRAPYLLIVIPLLLETRQYNDLIRRVLVVDCDEAQQVARAAARSRLAPEEVRAIMAAQLPRAERLRLADDILQNRGDLADLKAQVEKLHCQYLRLAELAGG
ncbi:MAG: dephospho-CoA kinase [Pseudomonadota bacterium]